MRLLAVLLAVTLQASGPTGPPPMPYEDVGACPFECCLYRDWTAQTKLTAYESHDPRSPKRVLFTIAPAERVTAMTGVVRTTAPGEARVEAPTVLEVYSKRFPRADPEKLTLAPGSRLYLLTTQGEGWRSGWYAGRLLESFDSWKLGRPDDCARWQKCTGIIEREPESEWWVRLRNARGKVGWVLMPRNRQAFTGTSGCS